MLGNTHLNAQLDSLFHRASPFFNLGKGLSINSGHSLLKTQDQETSRLSQQINKSLAKKVEAQQTATQKGKALELATQRKVQENAQTTSQSKLNQTSEHKAQGTVNGKPVLAHTDKTVQQTVQENKQSQSNTEQADKVTITRNGSQDKNLRINNTNYASESQGKLNTNSQLNRRTETDVNYKTYDKNGRLTTDTSNRQAVSVAQTASSERNWQSEGDRDVQQTSRTTELRLGATTLRETKTDTADASTSKQIYNTKAEIRTGTLVENLDAEGNVKSSRNSTQVVASNEDRTIDADRLTKTKQESHVMSRPGNVETHNETHYTTEALTVDKAKTTGTITDLNAAGTVVKERTYERNVNTITDEDRQGENHTWNSTATKNGTTETSMKVAGHEKADYNTRTISEQDGLVSSRTIDTKSNTETAGEITNLQTADGKRQVELNTEQIKESRTQDLSVAANGQARSVKTESYSSQAIEGNMNFDPATNQVATTAAPGTVTVEIGSFTGVRANFKLENGTLNFDFTARKMSSTDQKTVTGKIDGSDDKIIENSKTIQETGVSEEIHFTGQVVSSVDENGNRVISLKANMTDEGTGARFVNNLQGFQGEQSKAEMDIDGKMTVKRETEVVGNKTVVKATSNAELNLNRVENTESEGVNVTTMTPLNTTDGSKAGLIANNTALRFNFGVFNMSISFQA